MNIAFYSRFAAKNEQLYLTQALEQGLASDGDFARQLGGLLSVRWALEHVLPAPSCTHALETACRLLRLQAGDEVILPSFNFPSAANAVLLVGGVPVLCDIDPATQTLSIADIARRITPRTRGVIVVHYAGISCDMDALCTLCRQAGLSLIEDAAQGADAFFNGRALGSFGRFAAYSFHHTKNFSCGEGGAFVCTDNDLRAAEIFREKGTDRSRYLRGESTRYAWIDVGSSQILSEPCAALLTAQLECADEITARRLSLMAAYDTLLAPLEARGILRRMTVPSYARSNGHIYYVRFPNQVRRDEAMHRLRAAGAECHTHYVPLHLSPMGKALGYGENDLPESRAAYETLLRLPIHTGMSEADVCFVVHVLEQAVAG